MKNEIKNNACVYVKESKGFKNLRVSITLTNGKVVDTEIVVNPYDKNVVKKLHALIVNNL